MNLKIISAGAGSGKTYRLTTEMVSLLKGGVRANGIIATTFTTKAAAELQERVRVRLLEEGLTEQADALTNALIGTVHGLGVKLLRRFSFEAGVSPEVDIIADEDQQIMFNQSLSTVLTMERVERMERLSDRLGLNKRERYDWRKEVKNLTDVARANDFSIEVLEKSKEKSFAAFQAFLGELNDCPQETFNEQLKSLLQETIQRLENNEDSTKKTSAAVSVLQGFYNELKVRQELYWHQWVKISKIDVGAKSRDDVADLVDFAQKHDTHPAFHEDVKAFIYHIFEIAIAALKEYDQYKKSRGLIDYTDMEVLIKRLLANEAVKEVLAEELDLLMVDEFQDTSPIQLEIFLKLSKLAKYSIWVGDPKQSIYGFRGADPKLMQAIIEKTGGVKPEDIQTDSWRSRQDIVYATNAIFTKAFDQLPEAQVALNPKRTKKVTPNSLNKADEPSEVEAALMHWHFQYDGEGRRLPGRPWMENCIAFTLRKVLDGKLYILPKGAKEYRVARPGDVAILCRSNRECQTVAEALHRAGMRAAISRSGLLSTAEAKVILACLKYVLNQYDSLSVAEILLLAGGKSIEEIIENRLDYIGQPPEVQYTTQWAADDHFIKQLNELRERVVELSSAEILNLLLEELDLRRIIASWGNQQQRLDNVDVLRKFALQYEEACNRLHSAASLGGFLLWLNDLENGDNDMQGSGEGPDAVNVMTYHRSKGLEWPVVICHSLTGNLRAEVWGVDIIPETEEVDLDNVLGNRWLRYWVNPYADQFRSTLLEERINESQVKADKKEQALQEEARLLYVGITRARDYLVFPTTRNTTKWLNRVWHKGDGEIPTLDSGTHESPWEWAGEFLDIKTETFPYPRDFTHVEMGAETIQFIEPRAGKQQHQPLYIDLNSEKFSQEIDAKTGELHQYASKVELKDDYDKYQVAKVIKAFLTADEFTELPFERLEMAAAFVARYDVEEMLDPKSLIRTANAWWTYLDRSYEIKKVYRKYPVRYFWQGRLFEKIVDLILETNRGIVVFQNSGFAGEQKKWRNKALELGDWFHLSKSALQEAFNTPDIRTYVHFVMNGAVMEVRTEDLRM